MHALAIADGTPSRGSRTAAPPSSRPVGRQRSAGRRAVAQPVAAAPRAVHQCGHRPSGSAAPVGRGRGRRLGPIQRAPAPSRASAVAAPCAQLLALRRREQAVAPWGGRSSRAAVEGRRVAVPASGDGCAACSRARDGDRPPRARACASRRRRAARRLLRGAASAMRAAASASAGLRRRPAAGPARRCPARDSRQKPPLMHGQRQHDAEPQPAPGRANRASWGACSQSGAPRRAVSAGQALRSCRRTAIASLSPPRLVDADLPHVAVAVQLDRANALREPRRRAA